MANTFQSETAVNIGTSEASVYTCPASTQTTIIGLSISNISATDPVYATVYLDATGRTSGARDKATLIKSAPIYLGGSLVLFGGDQKLVLEPGDMIKVVSDTASSLDVVLSHLEIT
jgi:hypothetical protein